MAIKIVWIFLILCLLACGKKTNPVIPVKVLPKGVDVLSYQVKGKSLVISWSIPNQNTDGSPLTDLKGFKFLKGEWSTRDFCPTCPDNFQETIWIDLKGPETAGLKIALDQVQLTYDRLQPGMTYSFQVIAVTRKEATSEPSKTLRVAWDLPLTAPSEVQVKPKGQGLEISWEPPLSLIDGSLPEGLVGYALYRQQGKGPWAKVTPDPITSTRYLDEKLQESVTYFYQVKALRKIHGNFLESEGSEEKGIVFTRIAPPPAVQELTAIPNPNGIEIRWQGIEIMTPSGYHIYKRSGGEKTALRITQEPLTETIYVDRQVMPGKAYFYSVSAVGGPPSLLEGPRSMEIEIIFRP